MGLVRKMPGLPRSVLACGHSGKKFAYNIAERSRLKLFACVRVTPLCSCIASVMLRSVECLLKVVAGGVVVSSVVSTSLLSHTVRTNVCSGHS